MDDLKVERRPLRGQVTRVVNEMEAELAKDAPDAQQLRIKNAYLEKVHKDLEEVDKKIKKQMVVDKIPDQDQDTEWAAIEEYELKVLAIQDKVTMYLESSSSSSSHDSSFTSSSPSGQNVKKTYRLPKFEIKKFKGELLDWLGWWSQYKRIHEDQDLHKTDKFQYLMQSLVEGSEAYQLVSRYPQSEENYDKAITALEERYGKKKLLRRVYVRELLKLVITTARSKEQVQLSTMYDKLESHLHALESLGEAVDPAEFIFPMVESSLPEESLIAWQRAAPLLKQQDPDKKELDHLRQFLKQEVDSEQERNLAKSGFDLTSDKKENRQGHHPKKGGNKKDGQETIPTGAHLFQGQTASGCIFCGKGHASQECFSAQRMTIEERRQKVKEGNACFACLKTGHSAKKCNAKIKCVCCSRKHYVIMCPDFRPKSPPPSTSRNFPGAPTPSQVPNTQMINHSTGTVMLGTILVKLCGPNGEEKIVRMVMDSGAMQSAIIKSTAEQLGFPKVGEEMRATALFGGRVTDHRKVIKYEVDVKNIKSEQKRKLHLSDEPRICVPLPRVPVGPWTREFAKKNIWFSDYYSDSEEIEILIGNDYYQELVTGKRMKLPCGLVAVETVFGWTLNGPVPEGRFSYTISNLSVSLFLSQAKIQDLWDLEAIGIKDPSENKTKTEQDEEALRHFAETVTRKQDGRYSVSLPWVDGAQQIPDNFAAAEKRLQNTTRKLQKVGQFEAYDAVFKNWEEEDFIEEVENDNSNNLVHYLPHRAVIKSESRTTPVRPVYDGSFKSGRNPSLNDCLVKGPNLLELIPDILLRFREKKIGVIADIRKAFQMIEVNEADRDFLRFLWWKVKENGEMTIKIYRHKRVVFGLNCSPFLLAAVIKKHLSEVRKEDKAIAEKILAALYVDNLATSVDSYEEYLKLREVATRLFEEIMMELRQWANSIGSAAGIGSSECGLAARDTFPTTLDIEETTTSVLGMAWDREQDTLSCVIKSELDDREDDDKIYTKRSLLSQLQKIYDPIGLLSPALILPKLLLQKSWQDKIDWDQELTEEMNKEFTDWLENVRKLSQVRIPRHISPFDEVTNMEKEEVKMELHTFCDASQYAYATVIFLRTEYDGQVSVRFLQSKARVAPMKKTSIPRLELLGCVIGARLTVSIQSALDLKAPTYFWSDSTTALAWIQRNDNWGTFVGNRVKEICKLTAPEDWRHVPGIHNSADLPSRGCSPSQYLESRWWEGPEWLYQPKEKWPVEEIEVDEETVSQERKKTSMKLLKIEKVTEAPWYMPFSTYQKNVRFVAIMRKFINYMRGKEISPVSYEDLCQAETTLIGLVQSDVFPEDESEIGGVRVYRLEDGLIHVRTKLTNRQDAPGFKSPILLPSHHPLVTQIIVEEHQRNCHAGVQLLVGILRERFWILQARRTIRSAITSCIRCIRFKSQKPNVEPAPLPENRVKTAKVFEIVGVDLAGPLYLKNSEKVWVVLYTCAVYRCLHLELVPSLSTEAFLDACSRFCSRRGRPSIVYSDNGTNFKGADNAFHKMNWIKIDKEFQLKRIQWKFNPPSAAWWGGWWERFVRTIKELLRRTLGRASLTYEKLYTLICEIEGVINRRPLTAVSDDPEDLSPLSPSMFLSEMPCSEFNEFLDASGFQQANKQRKTLLEELKMRFRREYLAMLVHREKEKKVHHFEVGDIVLVGTDNKKRWEWPMARILELIPGKDGHVRVARVKTQNGEFMRPIQRLYPMEVSSPKNVPHVPDPPEDIPTDEPKEDIQENPEIVTRFGRKVKTPNRLTY